MLGTYFRIQMRTLAATERARVARRRPPAPPGAASPTPCLRWPWRPQQKRAKEHRNLIDGLAKADEVATGGGLMGRITRVSDDLIKLEISEGVEVVIQKPAVALLLPKGTMKDAAKA